MLNLNNLWIATVTFPKGSRGERGREGPRGNPGPPGPAGLPSLYLWRNTQEEWAAFMVRLCSLIPSLSVCNLWNIIALESNGCKPGPVLESNINSTKSHFSHKGTALCTLRQSDWVMAASLLDSISDSKFELLPRPPSDFQIDACNWKHLLVSGLVDFWIIKEKGLTKHLINLTLISLGWWLIPLL